ncbi:Uncharacterised protein [Mycobacterium tuberculosis]|nr:Uncharacterised protein [Mycobacterium tuberculosis]
MNIVKQIAWWLYAVLASVLTLGIWCRSHLVTIRMRTMGGVRAGVFGGTHIYRESESKGDFLVISRWRGKSRYPVSRIASASTGLWTVGVESSGGNTNKLPTWQTRTVAAFINSQVRQEPVT